MLTHWTIKTCFCFCFTLRSIDEQSKGQFQSVFPVHISPFQKGLSIYHFFLTEVWKCRLTKNSKKFLVGECCIYVHWLFSLWIDLCFAADFKFCCQPLTPLGVKRHKINSKPSGKCWYALKVLPSYKNKTAGNISHPFVLTNHHNHLWCI